MQLPFLKMNGLGNDFVIIDDNEISLTADQIRHICDRHYGVGCDQFVQIKKSDVADCFVSFYNSDGSQSDACGNATRCVASIIFEKLLKNKISIQTNAGIIDCLKNSDGLISVNIGVAKNNWQQIPLAFETNTNHLPLNEGGLSDGVAVNVGNPHAVFFVDDVDKIDLKNVGPSLENNNIFPQKANIEIVQIIDRENINVRVWERGTGLTLACGTGACATAYAANKRGLTGNNVNVSLPGGTLNIKIEENGDIIMTGSIETNFTGTIQI